MVSNGVTYTLVNNSYYVVSSYDNTNTNIKISTYINYLPVVAINESAFRNSNINTISIPNTITSIGNFAFRTTRNLIQINIQNDSNLVIIGDNAFDESNITSINIPDSVTSIGTSAFSNTVNLNEININASSKLQIINGNAFFRSNIKKILIPNTVTTIDFGAFSNCFINEINISNNSKLQIIKDSVFTGSFLTKINIPDGVTALGAASFSRCVNLTEINISNNSKLNTINYSALQGSAIKNINIPKGVTKITEDAFKNCLALATVSFQGEMPLIESNAFAEVGNKSFDIISEPCYGYYNNLSSWNNYIKTNNKIDNLILMPMQMSLIKRTPTSSFSFEFKDTTVSIKNFNDASKDIYIPPYINYSNKIYTVSEISQNVFDSKNIISIQLPSTITYIGKGAFKNSLIDTINIPASITTIDDEAFYGTLKTITFDPNIKLTQINNSVFEKSKITSIIIPASVTSIGYHAFAQTKNLNTVNFEMNSKLSYIGVGAFNNSALASIIIPKSVTKIDDGAFENSERNKNAIKSITFEKGIQLTKIPDRFALFNQLKTITIPESVILIGKHAFIQTLEFDNGYLGLLKDSGVSFTLQTVIFEGKPPIIDNYTGLSYLRDIFHAGKNTSKIILNYYPNKGWENFIVNATGLSRLSNNPKLPEPHFIEGTMAGLRIKQIKNIAKMTNSEHFDNTDTQLMKYVFIILIIILILLILWYLYIHNKS